MSRLEASSSPSPAPRPALPPWPRPWPSSAARSYTGGPAGKIEGGTVLIEDGKVRAVGRDVAVPAGARRIDATGKVVTPGFMDSLTRLGLVEVGAVEEQRRRANQDDRDHRGLRRGRRDQSALDPHPDRTASKG